MRIRYLLFALLTLVLSQRSGFAQSDAEPSKNDFVDVEKEPMPLTPIESHVTYPEAARRAGLEGKVIVVALIEKDGHVSKAEVEKSDNKIFESAAVDAVKATRFSPAMQSGKPVRVWVSRTINFRLTTPAEAEPENPFVRLMSMGVDSLRMALASIGPIQETRSGNLRTMAAATEDSLSHDDAPAYMTATIGPKGPTRLVIGFRQVSEEDFKSFATMAFGRTIRATINAELDALFVEMKIEAATQSYEIKLTQK